MIDQKYRQSLRLFGAAILLAVLGGLVLTDCRSKYMVRDDHGKFIPPLEQNVAYGDTPFERSLYSSYEDLYDVDKIRYYIMLDLLKGLTKHDGPNTPRFKLLEELNNLHVITDSARVRRIFHDGLLALDRQWGKADSNSFLEVELRKRAEQIRQCGCFLPQSERYFDELGRLVARLGVYEIAALDEGGMIVAFSNGLNATIGLDKTFEHRVLRASRNLDKLLNRRDLDQLQAAEHKADGSPPGGFNVAELRDSFNLKVEEMDAYGAVALDLGYDELDINRINLHILPTTYGNGPWNGQTSETADAPWHWSRAFLDFYINLDDIDPNFAYAEYRLNLSIDYEIVRHTDSGIVELARETIPFHQVITAAEKGDGISFRLFTLPIETADSQAIGDYQLDLRISDGNKSAVRKYPFTIADRVFDLLLVDTEGTQYTGIPKCLRIPEASRGQKVTVLIPVKNLPYSSRDSAYCATASLYLFRNDEVRRGTVRVSDLYAFSFGDSSIAVVSPIADQAADSVNMTRPVTVFEIKQTSSNAYLTYTFRLPKELADGKRLRSGKYTLAAMVTAGNRLIAEALISDLTVR